VIFRRNYQPFKFIDMEKKFTFKLTLIVMAAILLLSGCSSTTLIQSHPSGAKVYIDGVPVGVTPYWYSDLKPVASRTDLDLIKDGYESISTSFTRDEQINVGVVFGGFLCWPLWVWSMGYNPAHTYELVPLMPKPQQDESVIEGTQTPQQPQTDSNFPKIQKLRELKQMLDENLITKDDFEKQKKKILDEN
jgi:hypothetical protein